MQTPPMFADDLALVVIGQQREIDVPEYSEPSLVNIVSQASKAPPRPSASRRQLCALRRARPA
jgi:hypothetical protein